MTGMTAELSRRRLLELGAFGLAGAGAAVIASTFPGVKSVRRSGIAFGTIVSITLVDDGKAEIEHAFVDAFAAIRTIESAASLFDPASEISRLNRDGYIENPSSDLVMLVDSALRLAEASSGAFDPTVQPIWLAWQSAQSNGLPSKVALDEAVARVGYRAVRCEPGRISLGKAGMALTLNAIAQGYATDRVLAAVGARGIRHAFIDTGEIGARGYRASGAPWRVSVANPRTDRSITDVPLASRHFIATSADNACHWTPDFSEHHITEPWSGHSPRELAEVAVIASSGLIADGLSTAAMVSGRDRAIELLAAIDSSSAALFVDKSGRVTATGEVFNRVI